ncbi:MAG TPA: glycosyltransferase [Microthrixaceae bacterium]|jgi:glucosyl-3-phosphoglycerate synthase|nr:glycosyltransferase [Microthrixaceae bacterium]
MGDPVTTPRRFAPETEPERFRHRERSVTVCVPVFNEREGIARSIEQIALLCDGDLIDRFLVLDGGSDDGTRDLATTLANDHANTSVLFVEDLATEVGPVLGKGDSMWRSQAAIDTDVVVYLDADLLNVSPNMALSLAAPLVFGDEVDFTKGLFHRVTDRGDPREYDGGRVTELVARPLINLVCADLARYYQPLGGQVGIRTDLLASLPVVTAFGVEIGMLFDVSRRVGHDRIGEVELGDLVNSEKGDGELLPMAQQVAYTLLTRAGCGEPGWVPAVRPTFDGDLRVVPGSDVVERPPWIERPGRG